MKNHIIFTTIILLLGLGQVTAQPGKSKDSSEKHLLTASELLTKSSYYNAIKFLKQALVQDPDKVTTVYLLADTYHKARDYGNAADYYGLLIDSKDPAVFLNYPLIRLRYAETLQQSGSYNKALEQYETFAKSYNSDDAETYIQKANMGAAGCRMAIEAADPPMVRVRALSGNVNAGYTDYAPLPVGDSMLLFSSIRSKQLVDTEDSDYPHSKIYVAEKSGSGRWGKARIFNSMISGGRDHVGHGAFSPDGNRFYYTECPAQENRQAKCKVYVSEYKDGDWKKPKSIKEINISGYRSTAPAVTRDSRGSERIYFASNRPNGKGGMDIWYTTRRRGGSYEPAVNFREINTPFNESTPYYDNDSGEFYFSSDGRAGYGGYDIFVVGSIETSSIRNLGLPINSSADDMYYVKDKNPERAFLVSNRASNLGVSNRTCCDNIYSVAYGEAPDEMPDAEPEFEGIAVSGFVYAATDLSVEELENARLKLFDNSRPSNPRLLDGKNSSTTKGYRFILEPEQEYLIEINKDGYVKETITVSTKDVQGNKTFRKDIYLLKQGVNVQGMVYSEDDRGNLTPYLGANIVVSQKKGVGASEVISNLQSQSDGYKIFLPTGGEYKIMTTADTYLTASFEVDARSVAASGQNTKDIILRPKKAGKTFKIENIYYDTNSSELRPESYPPLNELLLLLIDNPNITIEIGAHTDSKGDPDYNRDLSLKRAESVVDYLAAAGIARDRLLAEGYGEANPVASNDSDEGRQLNRRTEFKIVDLGN